MTYDYIFLLLGMTSPFILGPLAIIWAEAYNKRKGRA